LDYIGDPNGYGELMGLGGPYAGHTHQNIQQPDGLFRMANFEPTDGEQWFLRATDAITRVVDARISGELEYMQACVRRTLPGGRSHGIHARLMTCH
jgi:hypothetical protein